MKTIKERLANLLSVKSIVTVVLTSVFAYLSITGVIDAEKYMIIFTTVTTFYFGTQVGKSSGNGEG